MQKAIEWLKKQGLAKATSKALREARQGTISSYLHGQDGRIGVLVEVNTETDFAARSPQFKSFVHQLCLHIVAMHPLFFREEDIPESLREKEKSIFMEQAKREGKKEAVLSKMVQGRMTKWATEVCLLKQVFLASTQSEKPETVDVALKELVAGLGENVIIRRFVRYELGEQTQKESSFAKETDSDQGSSA